MWLSFSYPVVFFIVTVLKKLFKECIYRVLLFYRSTTLNGAEPFLIVFVLKFSLWIQTLHEAHKIAQIFKLFLNHSNIFRLHPFCPVLPIAELLQYVTEPLEVLLSHARFRLKIHPEHILAVSH